MGFGSWDKSIWEDLRRELRSIDGIIAQRAYSKSVLGFGSSLVHILLGLHMRIHLNRRKLLAWHAILWNRMNGIVVSIHRPGGRGRKIYAWYWCSVFLMASTGRRISKSSFRIYCRVIPSLQITLHLSHQMLID